jgi:AcrR family transcriptional regulator
MSRRTQILRRATEIFEQKGVAQTSMEDIAQAVGVKREALYYYFRSRDDILLEIILPQSSSLISNIRQVLDTRLDSMGKLRAAIERHLNGYKPGYLEMSVMLRENHHFKDERRVLELRRTWRDYNALWVQLIEAGQADGTFDASLDPKMTVFGILGMCNWVSRWYQPGKGASVDDLIETFFRITSRGIAAPE